MFPRRLRPPPEVPAGPVFPVIPATRLSLWDPTRYEKGISSSELLSADRAEGWRCLLVSPAVRPVLLFPVGKQNVKLRHLQEHIFKNEIAFSVCGARGSENSGELSHIEDLGLFFGGVEGGKVKL